MDKFPSWFWVLLPANAAMSGFGTMAPLYIIKLGGDVVEASAVSGLLNLAIIPSVVVWGAVTDRLPRRRPLFIAAYLGTAIAFLLLFQAPTIAWILAFTTFLGFFWIANSPSQSLLIMETSEKRNWFNMFALSGFISNLGAIAGLVMGLFWTDIVPLRYFFLFCSASAAAALVLSTRLVGRSPVILETRNLLFSPLSALARIQTTASQVARIAALIPSRLFSRRAIAKAYRTVVTTSQGRVRRLFVASFLFNFAANFYGGSYVPFLSFASVASSLIFGISLANTVVQTFTYRYVGSVKSRLGEARTGSYSTTLMCICYVAIAASTLLVRGSGLFGINLAANLAMGFGLAAWNSFNSTTVFSELRPESQGGAIGLFSALNSFGVVLGAFLSGVASLYLGYMFTFAVASVLMVVSMAVRSRAPHENAGTTVSANARSTGRGSMRNLR